MGTQMAKAAAKDSSNGTHTAGENEQPAGVAPAGAGSWPAWEGWLKHLIAPAIPILIAVAGSYFAMNTTVSRSEERLLQLEARVDQKGNADTIENALKVDHEEITNLRNQMQPLLLAHNVAVGKYETAVAAHGTDIAGLRAEVTQLTRALAKVEAALERMPAAAEKVDLGPIRERLAALEAVAAKKDKAGPDGGR
jgi:hypothetical protein